MDAEIIAIGSELLLGTTVDTNSVYLAGQFASAGLTLLRKTAVGDSINQIAAAVDEALGRADFVLCTGGLGPTVDDVTREAVALATGRPLELRPELLEQIAARFAAFKRPMSESNRRQAYVPQGARAIENPRGTAPAFIVEDTRGTVIVLPGVPHEMRFLFETAVLPYLRNERGIRDVILVRVLHAAGMGESLIGERIADLMEQDNPELGISAKQARYELRIAARAESEAAAEAMLAEVEAELHRRLGAVLLGSEQLDDQVGRLLAERQLTLTLYEGHTAAPLYRACSASALLQQQVQGVVIHPLDQPVDATAAAALAAAGAQNVQNRWRSDLALGMQTTARQDAHGFSTICLALVFAGGTIARTSHYDLRQRESWEVVGTFALDLLRQYLLNPQAAV